MRYLVLTFVGHLDFTASKVDGPSAASEVRLSTSHAGSGSGYLDELH